MKKFPNITRPCSGHIKCPFRKDCQSGWLGRDRIIEIIKGDSFVCQEDHSKQCAGHMLLLEYNNLLYRTAKRMKIEIGLTGRELVFDSVTDCINHHSNQNQSKDHE